MEKLMPCELFSRDGMATLEQMPRVNGECTDCGREHTLRVWPDGELRAVGTGGACMCGSLSFDRLG